VHSNEIFIFNDSDQNWEPVGNLPVEMYASSAIAISDNTILVIGGEYDNGHYSNAVWIGSFEP